MAQDEKLLGAMTLFGATNKIIDRYEVQGDEVVAWDGDGKELVRVPITEPTVVRRHYDEKHEVYRHNTT
jgi:nitrate reductase beta subunit